MLISASSKHQRILTFIISGVLYLLFAIPAVAQGGVGIPKTAKGHKLKAVVVVGTDLIGETEGIESSEEIAVFLEEKGVEVHRFFVEDSNWDDIKKAANGAHFFVYRGHGGRSGGKAGGLYLTTTVSNETIRQELKLHRNAVVVFLSVCNGAGSSATDDGDIGIEEAKKRVTSYAHPFVDIGASCYYANNLGSGGLNFLKDFFDGKTLDECYETSTATWVEVEMNETYTHDTSKNISIASADWGGFSTVTTIVDGKKVSKKVPASKHYSIAFVGDGEFSIEVLLRN